MTTRLMKYLYHKSFVVFVLLVLVAIPSYVLAYSSPGKATGYVNDFAGVLTLEQKNMLESKLAVFNASTSNEIAVVTVKNLGGDYIENYAVQLFKEWGIGTAKKDNGVLLLVALEDRKMRIEVGYGLEGALTDSLSSAIIRNDLTPAFKQNDFYGGINLAADHIIEATRGEYTGDVKGSKVVNIPPEALLFTLVLVVQFLSAILGRSKSWWAGGVMGGVAGLGLFYFLGMTFLVGGVVTAVLTLLGLLFDYIVSNRYAQAVRNGSPIPWWIGGQGRSGGSSFGGFGGGSSGGGGASGSW